MTTRRETAERMLTSSERVREELLAAVGRLDSYIEMLRTDISVVREDVVAARTADHEPTTP